MLHNQKPALSNLDKVSRLLLSLLFTLFVGLQPSLLGCAAEATADDQETSVGDYLKAADRFPPRGSVEFAMDRYIRDPKQARARDPMSLEEFFGSRKESSNKDTLRVELLNPNPRLSTQPIAFLRAQFHNTDMTWNNRYKDVQLFRLVDATGTAKNPFPEAAHVAHEGAALVRMWNEYKPIKDGAPPDLTGPALQAEIARISVWSYVSGNIDGPAKNGNNGGFSKMRDASGREFWSGVLIDSGATWNKPDASQLPWNTNLLGKGPVEAAHIPKDVVNSLTQIARSNANDLATKSRFEKVDDGALSIVRDIRDRAREVLDHYGLPWKE